MSVTAATNMQNRFFFFEFQFQLWCFGSNLLSQDGVLTIILMSSLEYLGLHYCTVTQFSDEVIRMLNLIIMLWYSTHLNKDLRGRILILTRGSARQTYFLLLQWPQQQQPKQSQIRKSGHWSVRKCVCAQWHIVPTSGWCTCTVQLWVWVQHYSRLSMWVPGLLFSFCSHSFTSIVMDEVWKWMQVPLFIQN